MSIRKKIIENSKVLWKTAIPHLSVDSVVFGFPNNKLCVLVLRMEETNALTLPGGYVNIDENLDDAVHRVLKERTSLKQVYLQQFATFGNAKRSEAFFESYPANLWHKQRFISTCYYALVDHTKVKPVPDDFASSCEWIPVESLRNMAMDHHAIVKKALQVLREQLIYKPIGYNLLPKEFTMPELQNLYEAILGYQLNRGNFYRRIMRYEILKQLDKKRTGGSHKAPSLYEFDKKKYDQTLNNFNW